MNKFAALDAIMYSGFAFLFCVAVVTSLIMFAGKLAVEVYADWTHKRFGF